MPDTERILIIGGGCGIALAHDLSLRGLAVTLVERGELTSGTTGRHHGLLHSGARYAMHDPDTAAECYAENQILRRIAPQAIEPNDGLFVALGADTVHLQTFISRCTAAGIPVRQLSGTQARRLEPALSPEMQTAVQVPDAAMDAWRLAMQFAATAKSNGAILRTFTEVIGLRLDSRGVTGVVVKELGSGKRLTLGADMVVNAAGPWAGRIAAMAGLNIPMQPSPGVMVAVKGRWVNMVINRLQPAGEGDIIVPQRTLSVLGTTAWLVDDPDTAEVPEAHIHRLRRLAGRLVPEVARAPVQAVWSASRPLYKTGLEDDPFGISRGFTCLDHEERDGMRGLISLVGGKATTMRAMAEQAADTVCRKLGRQAACRTRQIPLLSWRQAFAAGRKS